MIPVSRNFLRNVPQHIRYYCKPAISKELVTLDTNEKTGFAILTLNRPPVNSLNLELLTSISNALDEAAKNKVKGLILTSGNKTVFSAGLDITEMYKPNETRLREFWSKLQEVWLKLYGSAIPTAAAINGHAPAGGCLLSISCEYRVMCPNYTIGLNETQLGIVAPTWFIDSYTNVISRRVAEKALTTGKMFSTDEAFKVGLIDEIATDKNDAIAKCETFLSKFRKIPSIPRGLTKQSFRREALLALENNRDQDLQLFLFAVQQKAVQQSLEVYFDNLKNKSDKK